MGSILNTAHILGTVADDLLHLGVHGADLRADDNLQLVVHPLYFHNAGDFLQLFHPDKTLVLQIHAKAGHAVGKGTDVVLAADEFDDLYRHIAVLVSFGSHVVSSCCMVIRYLYIPSRSGALPPRRFQ